MYASPLCPPGWKKAISERQRAHLVKARACRRFEVFKASQLDLFCSDKPAQVPPPYNNRGTRNSTVTNSIPTWVEG